MPAPFPPTPNRIIAAALLLASCGPGDQTELDNFNRTMAETNALLASFEADLPRGWYYRVETDRIRNQPIRLAGLPNEDEGQSRDQKLLLMIQQDGDEPVSLFFRGRDGNGLRCATVCGVAFRAGDKTGSWTAQRDYAGDAVYLVNPGEVGEALEIIRSNRSLIIEIDSDFGGQYEFKTEGYSGLPKAE